jgi:hypothetical protein
MDSWSCERESELFEAVEEPVGLIEGCIGGRLETSPVVKKCGKVSRIM